MESLNLPESMIEPEKYTELSPLQKGEYATNLLLEILKLNPIGITVSQIKKKTYLSHSVIWHHLEILAAIGECLRVEQGDVDIYFHNKVTNTLNEFDFSDSTSDFKFVYNFDLVENTFGEFIRIQRQKEGRTHAHFTRSGVIIPYNLVDKIANSLIEIKKNHLSKSNEKF